MRVKQLGSVISLLLIVSGCASTSSAERVNAAPVTDVSGAQEFARILAENPKRLFDLETLGPDARARLDKFPAPDCGASVTKLRPMEGRSISDIKAELLENGFREAPPATPNARKPPDMEIFVHADGGSVKIKPNGDGSQFIKFGRKGPMASKEVVIDRFQTGEALTGFANVAFKVTDANQPIPREMKHLQYPPDIAQDKTTQVAFGDAWADAGHKTPATPPGFIQRTTND